MASIESQRTYASRLKRIDMLKKRGVVNVYRVINNGEEERDYYIVKVGADGRIMLPSKLRKQLGIEIGDTFNLKVDETGLILEARNEK